MNPTAVPRSRLAVRLRAGANLVNLTTPLGLAVAVLGGARIRRGPDGLWLGEHYRPRLPRAAAFTIGNVVTTRSVFDDRAPADLLDHEARHAWQYAGLGTLFFPLYAVASGWSWLRYASPALGNVFEQRAGLISGGYLADGATPPAPRWPDRGSGGLRRSRPPSGSGPSGPADGGPAAAAAV